MPRETSDAGQPVNALYLIARRWIRGYDYMFARGCHQDTHYVCWSEGQYPGSTAAGDEKRGTVLDI